VGYLVAIAVIALLIGAGALWLGERVGMGVTDTRSEVETEMTHGE
jgi:hypothetical protein